MYDKKVHMNSMCRQINDCANNVSEQIRGIKGVYITDAADNIIFGIMKVTCFMNSTHLWMQQGTHLENDPYVQEHIDLVTAIRTGNQIVEAEETAKSVLTAIMGQAGCLYREKSDLGRDDGIRS